jgi:hypothetical protein
LTMHWKELFVPCLLCVALATAAPMLKKQHDGAKRVLVAARGEVKRNPSLGFPSLGGIELNGKVFGPVSDAAVNRTLVCRLRTSSLTQDLAGLADVARVLHRDTKIDLVAYCDGPDCSQALRTRPSALPFPVVTHGEVVASQALATADERGECLLVDKGFTSVKAASWRKPGVRTEDFVREIAK